jgi:hypothetical protein
MRVSIQKKRKRKDSFDKTREDFGQVKIAKNLWTLIISGKLRTLLAYLQFTSS